MGNDGWDPYAILEVDRSASLTEIKSSFRRLAKAYHPDWHANGSEDDRVLGEMRMQEINRAHQYLSDLIIRQDREYRNQERQEQERREEWEWQDRQRQDAWEQQDRQRREDWERQDNERRAAWERQDDRERQDRELRDRDRINPRNVPLTNYPTPQRSTDAELLWQQTAVEPILIRFDSCTGLTVMDTSTSEVTFLGGRGHLQVARSAAGLVGLLAEARKDGQADLVKLATILESVQPADLSPDPEHEYDISAALVNLVEGVESWNPVLLAAAFDLCYWLGRALGLETVEAMLHPSSLLGQIRNLLPDLDLDSPSRWDCVQQIREHDLTRAYREFADIVELIELYTEWHS